MYKWFAGIAVLLLLLSIVTFSLTRVKDNPSFDKEINTAVKALVDQVIMVKYKTHCFATLGEIFTEELVQNLDDYYPSFFSDETFYFVSNNYMHSLRQTEDNQWYVTVEVYERMTFDPHYFLAIGITKNEQGVYLISFIGKDA